MVRRPLLVLGFVVGALAARPGGVASPPSPPPQSSSPVVAPLDDAAATAAFADAFFTAKLRKPGVPGAVFVLVKDGRILVAKGYGYANVEARRPVDVARTIFRVGSVSKVFTAAAVMQLQEQGRVRLDEDVNGYLRLFKLPDRFGAPVTLAHLLTHTGGFDGRHIAMHARTGAEFVPLGPFLARRMPDRVLPPGDIIAYNDFGMSLAGHVVETVSGQPFDRYMEDAIFGPLGMTNTSFAQPMPAALMARLATGYAVDGSGPVAYPYDFAEVSPAAALQTSGGDMAAFIIACLQRGRYGDARIMADETATRMMARHVTHHPRIRGRAFGFSESLANGQRILFHDGGMPGFVARIALLPDRGVGFFIAANVDQWSPGAGLAGDFTGAFLDRYFPAPPLEPIRPPADFRQRAARFAGYYRSLHEYSAGTMEKFESLGNQLLVEDAGDGTLRAGDSRLVEVEPLLFRWTDAEAFVAFKEAADGPIARMFIGTGALEKVAWYESRPFQLGLAVFFGLALVGTTVAIFLVRADAPAGRRRALGRWLVASQAALAFLFAGGMFVALTSIDRWQFTYGLPASVQALLVLPLVTLATAVGLTVAAVLAWRARAGGRLVAVLATAAAVGLALVGWLHYWNLVGFRT